MTTLLDHDLLDLSSAPQPESARNAAADQPREQPITLRGPDRRDGFVDGGWWPRTHDLLAELPALLMAVEAAGYDEVRRVSYAMSGWDGQPPRRSIMLNRVVKLGGFRSPTPAEICLVDGSGWKRVILVVVPPDTDPTIARRALTIAGLSEDRHRAHEILELAHDAIPPPHAIQSACVDELAAAGWDTEGGRVVP